MASPNLLQHLHLLDNFRSRMFSGSYRPILHEAIIKVLEKLCKVDSATPPTQTISELEPLLNLQQNFNVWSKEQSSKNGSFARAAAAQLEEEKKLYQQAIDARITRLSQTYNYGEETGRAFDDIERIWGIRMRLGSLGSGTVSELIEVRVRDYTDQTFPDKKVSCTLGKINSVISDV